MENSKLAAQFEEATRDSYQKDAELLALRRRAKELQD